MERRKQLGLQSSSLCGPGIGSGAVLFPKSQSFIEIGQSHYNND